MHAWPEPEVWAQWSRCLFAPTTAMPKWYICLCICLVDNWEINYVFFSYYQHCMSSKSQRVLTILLDRAASWNFEAAKRPLEWLHRKANFFLGRRHEARQLKMLILISAHRYTIGEGGLIAKQIMFADASGKGPCQQPHIKSLKLLVPTWRGCFWTRPS